MKYIVGLGDMKVSNNKDDILVTYALGSCLGISAHDPVACVGGLLHVMLPNSIQDPTKAAIHPYLYVDTGVRQLLNECYELGAERRRLVIKAAGGACQFKNENGDMFHTGKKNFIMLRKILWGFGLLMKSYDIGENYTRTMILEIGTGAVTVRVNGIYNRL